MKKISSFLFLFTMAYGISQVSSNDEVYAGRSFTWGINMTSYDLVVLLRQNGTFCEDLEEPDWQTRITGRYKKGKNQIVLEYLDTTMENDTIFFEKDREGESIYYGGTQMVKMIVPNKVPEGYYDFSSASSSGGMGTGMVYVGTQNYEGYSFYNDGAFNRSSSGGVAVIGSSIGGGTSSESSGKGKYTIKNGLLTLNYDDGTIEKHSFFYDQDGGKEFMVAIDGSIFFYGDNDKEIDEEPEKIQQEASLDTDVSKTLESSGMDVLKSIKKAHGGKNIDEINTLQANIMVSGIPFKVLMDVDRLYLRLESMSANFKYIEQLEGNTGWVFQNNTTQSISKERVEELKLTFYSGIFGLQSKILNRASVVDIRETEDNFLLITLSVHDNNTIGYVVDKNTFILSATFIFKNGTNEITYTSNLQNVDGVLLPYKEITETNEGTVEITYQEYRINPVLDSGDWSKTN